MEEILYVLLPAFVAIGSALLAYYIMQAKMEIALARERESLAEARATISSQKITMEERIRATEEATRRHSLDEFMQEFRVEERSYMRESKSLSASRRSMVMQERLFFRNIPLSNWIEREMVVEEGVDLERLPKESVFQSPTLPANSNANLPAPAPPVFSEERRLPISKFLDDISDRTPERPAERTPEIRRAPESTILVARIPAFGAQ